MAKQVQLKAKLRNVAGKTKVKRLRAQGSVHTTLRPQAFDFRFTGNIS